MVLFFTTPPIHVSYPYVLINAHNPATGLSYVYRYRSRLKVIIIDSGIEVFRDPKVKEYPGGPEAWIRRLVHLYGHVRSIAKGAEVLATCPDYPDDYHPGSLWVSDDYTNIERTIENVLTCIDWYSDVNWLIPVQGWHKRPSTLLWSLEYLEQLGVIKRYSYLAIANLSLDNNVRILKHEVMYAHSWLRTRGYRDFKLHVFGLKITALNTVNRYIHSFDSTAWTRPVSKRLHDAFSWSAKNEDERTLFFCEYILRLLHYEVSIPKETLVQCLNHVKRARKTLAYRYRDRKSIIEKTLNEIEKHLEELITG